VNDSPGESRALGPLWALTLGAVAGSGATIAAGVPVPAWLPWVVTLFGALLFVLAARRGRDAPLVLWFVAGLAAVGGHGLEVGAARHELEDLTQREDPVWIRARLAVTEGWAEGRWGWQTKVRVLDARHEHIETPRLTRCRLEVRGDVRPRDLPRPGVIVRAFVSIRGSPGSPLLVATSDRLIEPTSASRLMPVLRGRLTDHLLAAAGTDVARIRAPRLESVFSWCCRPTPSSRERRRRRFVRRSWE
jgi:hypothetical protein